MRYAYSKADSRRRHKFHDESQYTCIKHCMESRINGQISVEKHAICGYMCKDRLGIRDDDQNDDSPEIKSV